MSISYVDCDGNTQNFTFGPPDPTSICAREGTVVWTSGDGSINQMDVCGEFNTSR